jgi:hypothetical protein
MEVSSALNTLPLVITFAFFFSRTMLTKTAAAGTASGDGLANCLNQAPASSAQAFYQAARIYNSGSIDSSGNLGLGVATHCYSSDIANRLTGWVNAAHNCNL